MARKYFITRSTLGAGYWWCAGKPERRGTDWLQECFRLYRKSHFHGLLTVDVRRKVKKYFGKHNLDVGDPAAIRENIFGCRTSLFCVVAESHPKTRLRTDVKQSIIISFGDVKLNSCQAPSLVPINVKSAQTWSNLHTLETEPSHGSHKSTVPPKCVFST